MKKIILSNGNIVGLETTSQPIHLCIKDGLFAAVAGAVADESIDLDGATVFPGFIDIHNHGAVGVDVNEADANGLLKVGAFLAKNGVTAWMPTFVPDSESVYQKVMAAIRDVVAEQSDQAVAQIVGVHYEGVFANEQMCGALRPEFFKRFSGTELSDLPTLENAPHLTTYAPEVEGGIELTKALAVAGWIPSIGHTRADYATLERAFDAGAKHVTHLFNAMTGVHHRDVGVAGWALTKDEISCEIIADNIHVHPAMLRFAVKNKPADKLILVSDSAAPTGLGDGNFDLWGETISVVNGRTRNERGSIAGSVITMLDAVRNYLALGIEPAQVAAMASTNPARLLGLAESRGSFEVGKRADLVALDREGNVVLSMVGGRIV